MFKTDCCINKKNRILKASLWGNTGIVTDIVTFILCNYIMYPYVTMSAHCDYQLCQNRDCSEAV